MTTASYSQPYDHVAKGTLCLIAAIIALQLVEASNAAIIPVAHFAFDEPSKDQVAINSVGPNGMFVTYSIHPLRDIPNGVFGRAVNCGTGYTILPSDGVGGVIDSLSEFSVAAWVEKRGLATSALIGQLGDSELGWRILIGNYDSGTVKFITPTLPPSSDAHVEYFTSLPWQSGFDPSAAFQHVAITYGAGLAKLYINGELKAAESVTGSIVPSGSDYFIGDTFDRYGPPVSGDCSFDEVWVYRGVLSQSQVRAVMLMNRPVSEPSSAPLIAFGAALISYWLKSSSPIVA